MADTTQGADKGNTLGIGGPPRPSARKAQTIVGVGGLGVVAPKPAAPPPAPPPPAQAAPPPEPAAPASHHAMAFEATAAGLPPTSAPVPASFPVPATTTPGAFDGATLDASHAHVAAATLAAGTLPLGAPGAAGPLVGRTTLGVLSALPRVEVADGNPTLLPHDKPRFEEIRVLGEGGMGEVALVHDEDIDRTVAVKRLRPELQHPVAVARFVDEVRTVGRLEHPNIVPLHDVGLDAQGRFYFVMKYVEGETLEEIIEKLAAGSPKTQEKYTFEVRVQIFLSLLRALEYAHAKGIIHRDIKPANVMVGRYGEVVLMDWGIAKPLGASSLDLASAALPAAPGATSSARTLQTATGILVGTPAYMSPEQARGENDKLDVRSDLYAATALFYELMTTHHYLGEPAPRSLEELLEAVQTRVLPLPHEAAAHRGANQAPPPAEWLHFCRHGLEKDPAKRYSSATEMIERMQLVIDGRVPVECPVTLTKRVTRESSRFVDRHPFAAMSALAGGGLLLLWSLVATTLVFLR